MKRVNVRLKFIVIFVSLILLLSISGNVDATTEYYTGEKSNHTKNEKYLSGITEEMCTADYWKDKTFIDIDELLMNYAEIETLNEKTVDASGTMVFDLENLNETFNADTKKESLANAEIPTRALFINGLQINNQEYFTELLNAIKETGYSGEQQIKYGVCSNRANLKSWPTDDVVGYTATDPDDEIQSSAMNVNEPFVIQAKCEVNGNTYYWGYSTNCTGWVNAKNIAICETKDEWLDYWKVEIDADNFVVVTGSRIILKDENVDDISIMLGTILKLVPNEQMPEDLAKQADSNYVVYFAGNDENGNAVKKYALLSKQLEINQGFLPLTQSNVLDVAFSCIGDEYGWGGMNGNMDCSLYTRYIYRCFGFELPRNTTWQQKIPDKFTSISGMSDEEKAKYISTLPTGALLYFSGHTMVYIGRDNNKNFVVSDLGSVVDEGSSTVEKIYAVTVNSLDVKRGNGTTWLHNLTGVVSFANQIDISDCEIEIENIEYIYDGEEKKPIVTIKCNGNPIYEGVNFNIEYADNIDVGTATIKISGMNNFTGEIKKSFEIKENKDEENDNQDIKDDEKTEYQYIEGNGQTVQKGNNAIFKINADYSLFSKLYIDNVEVDSSNYQISEGSTVVKLFKIYISNLEESEHIIKVEFTDGKTATTTFTVVNNQNESDKENTKDTETDMSENQTSNEDLTNNATSVNNPSTGDNIEMYFMLFIISAIILVLTTNKRFLAINKIKNEE